MHPATEIVISYLVSMASVKSADNLLLYKLRVKGSLTRSVVPPFPVKRFVVTKLLWRTQSTLPGTQLRHMFEVGGQIR